MPLKIYNSLKRKKEEFKPLKDGEVTMYVCGPTVYDEPHIGHARSAYIFDVIRRYLKYRGYKILFVRNVTDVDDKIIDKARKEYPNENLNDAVKEVSKKYLDAYHRDMDALGIMRPDKEPKATEYIEKMQRFIKVLIDKGAAYQAGGDVYFDIKKAKGYGKLSNQSLENMEAGARVSPDEKKQDPLDFALWKSAKEGEPSWPSPWGNGRPGWHIECSVMSSDILGDEFDIHGGGIDLIFPHHENELAQSEGAGKNFARIWMHNGLLTINAQKMAKSLGNFVTIKDFMAKYKNPGLLKLFYLSAHYSHPIDYTEEKINEAKKALERIIILLKKIDRMDQGAGGNGHGKEIKEMAEFKDKFIEAMDDDFNTPQGLAAIFELVNAANKDIDNVNFVFEAKRILKELLSIFGINILNLLEDVDLEATEEMYVKTMVDERSRLKSEKKYFEADQIRKKLEEKNIILEDTKDGTTWRRKI